MNTLILRELIRIDDAVIAEGEFGWIEGIAFAKARAGNRCAAQKEMTPLAAPANVAAVLTLFIDLPETPLRAGRRDQ